MKTKKIKAFTLSELLVVLVISSIVIAMAFIVLGLVQKQISQIQNNFNDQQEIALLKKTLLHDINTHEVFFKQANDELFLWSAIDTIVYEFKPDYILRKKDTFKLKVIDKQFLLDDQSVKNGWIDAVFLDFNQSYSTKRIFMYKKKDAAHYLNH